MYTQSRTASGQMSKRSTCVPGPRQTFPRSTILPSFPPFLGVEEVSKESLAITMVPTVSVMDMCLRFSVTILRQAGLILFSANLHKSLVEDHFVSSPCLNSNGTAREKIRVAADQFDSSSVLSSNLHSPRK